MAAVKPSGNQRLTNTVCWKQETAMRLARPKTRRTSFLLLVVGLDMANGQWNLFIGQSQQSRKECHGGGNGRSSNRSGREPLLMDLVADVHSVPFALVTKVLWTKTSESIPNGSKVEEWSHDSGKTTTQLVD